MGLVVVGLGLLHITLWFWLLAWLLPRLIDGFAMSLEEITLVMLCFGIGASVMALVRARGRRYFHLREWLSVGSANTARRPSTGQPDGLRTNAVPGQGPR